MTHTRQIQQNQLADCMEDVRSHRMTHTHAK